MTKKKFNKIFTLFSILLFLAFPVLPFFEDLLTDKKSCEYSILKCILLMFITIIIFGFFWITIWTMNYVVFFLEDFRSPNFKKNKIFFVNWYIQYTQFCFYKNKFGKLVLIAMVFTLCSGVTWLFFYELYKIFKILL